MLNSSARNYKGGGKYMFRIILHFQKSRKLVLISVLCAAVFLFAWTTLRIRSCLHDTFPYVSLVRSRTEDESLTTSHLHMRPLPVKYNGTPISQLYQPGFDVEPTVCPEYGSGLEVVVVVHSTHRNEQQRMAIRQTWGSLSLRKDVTIVFLLGQSVNSTLVRSVREEALLYSDIILSRNLDSYENLTLKTVAMSEWVSTTCSKAKFFLKTDDDILLNVPRFLDFLRRSEVSAANRTIFGRLTRGTQPIRTLDHRHYVSVKEYPGDTYLDYLQGACYLVTGDLSKDLYEASLKSNFFKFEDIFFTGLMAEIVGAKRVGPDNFYWYVQNASENSSTDLDQCIIKNHTVLHFVYFKQMFYTWRTVFDSSLKC